MDMQRMNLVMIPQEELASLQLTQKEILKQLQNLQSLTAPAVAINHITAKEFMAAVRICRTKFDQLVGQNKIRTIKKIRKIYVPTSEVARFFSDASVR
jgi:hypothetical protein